MRYVSEILLFALLAMFALLTGCEDPELSVGSLDRKLPAPSLKGSSPFSQNFEMQNYVQVQGACDSRLGLIYISFDQQNWYIPPTIPDMAGTSLDASVVNDRDCSDGAFDVYLTATDLESIWGVTTDTRVNKIYIKAETLIGDSETLTLVNSNPDDGDSGSNNGGVPATLALEKNNPAGFAGSNQCEPFRVNVKTAAGLYTQTSSDITVKLEKKVAGAIYPAVAAYKTWADCFYETNPITSLTILAGTGGTDFLYKFPAAPLNGLFEFRLYDASSLTTDANYTSVTLRDSSAGSIYRWLMVEDQIHQLYKNTCYPLKIRSTQYNRAVANDQFPGDVQVGSSSANLKFYTDASCSTQTSSYSFGSYNSLINAYVKYVPSAGEAETIKSINLTLAGANSSYSYDSAPIAVNIDATNKSTAVTLDIWGSYELTRQQCQPYRIATINEYGTMMTATVPRTVNLATKESNIGLFYLDQTCSGSSVTSTSIAVGMTSTIVYFKPTVATAGVYNFDVSSAGLNSPSRQMKVSLAAKQFKIVPPAAGFVGGCKPFMVYMTDDLGSNYAATYSINFTFSLSLTPFYANRAFADASCTAPLGSSVNIPPGQFSGLIYVQTDGFSGATNFTLMVHGGYGLSGDTVSGTFAP
ncbi:hypothetical protein [Bdellovibrio reynosensis]|uniref:Hemagglutinin n=1 Tax=Bdellovibrio reynosensis TaxID=2835041 RepID=A0ABY4C4L4_9BACT|nr:hypothetical protein [Bdellovibrio reynosensis]UOE99906.1 hypothetical protein MNR06_09370 [Bdellovibrio reynosensis]